MSSLGLLSRLSAAWSSFSLYFRPTRLEDVPLSDLYNHTSQPTPTPPTLADLSDDEIERIKRLPSKYYGYPMFTQWMASDKEGIILRRFDQLHARVLLRMQDNIVRQEERLSILDRGRMNPADPTRYNNGSFREDEFPTGSRERLDILDDVEERLLRYG